MFAYLKRLDWLLILSIFLLFGIGAVSIYSSSMAKGTFFSFKKQLIFFGLGFSLMIVCSFFNWRLLKKSPYLILTFYGISLVSLASLLIFAAEIRGVKSWYKIGPVSLDPIEFTKLVLMFLLSKYFSSRHIEMYRFWHIGVSGIYVLIPCALIFLQPNLGSCLIILFLWLGILMVSRIRLRHFFILLLLFALVFSLGWSFFLQDYQKQRILSFAFPRQADILGIGWSQAQSETAISSGGFWGKGLGQGYQTQYGFLPEPRTDFIFAAIGEELGLMGISLVLLLYFVLLWRIMKIALESRDNFFRLFGAGFSFVLFSQIFVNIGMNLGLLPIIGIPLPFISYGGSNLIFNFAALGILQCSK